MQIRSDDINLLSDYLKDKWDDGHEWISYNQKADCLIYGNMSAFYTKDEAHANSLDKTMGEDYYTVSPLKPLMDTMLNLKEKINSMGTTIKFSLPFGIEQINNQYNLNTHLEEIIMDDKNVAYLEKQLLMTGMGAIPREELINKMTEGKEHFQISLERKIDTITATAVSNFKLSDKGMYFYNSYDMMVQKEGEASMNHNFKIRKPEPITIKGEEGVEEKKAYINSTITFKEAFNLLQGRSINKDFVAVNKEDASLNKKYNAWEHLDLGNADEKGIYPAKKVYNIDIEKLLSDYPIKELSNAQFKSELLSSLKRGNRQSVNFEQADGSTQKMFIEVNPKHNSIKIFDENQQPISLSIKISQASGVTKEVSTAENVSQSSTPTIAGNKAAKGNVPDVEEAAKKKQGKRKGHGV